MPTRLNSHVRKSCQFHLRSTVLCTTRTVCLPYPKSLGALLRGSMVPYSIALAGSTDC